MCVLGLRTVLLGILGGKEIPLLKTEKKKLLPDEKKDC